MWEYLTVRVSDSDDWKVEGRKGRISDWGVRLPNDQVILGWHNILLNYSMQGWELVSVVGESFPGFRVYHYRLFLKRPIEEGA
jgi:hypothetical protein